MHTHAHTKYKLYLIKTIIGASVSEPYLSYSTCRTLRGPASVPVYIQSLYYVTCSGQVAIRRKLSVILLFKGQRSPTDHSGGRTLCYVIDHTLTMPV